MLHNCRQTYQKAGTCNGTGPLLEQDWIPRTANSGTSLASSSTSFLLFFKHSHHHFDHSTNEFRKFNRIKFHPFPLPPYMKPHRFCEPDYLLYIVCLSTIKKNPDLEGDKEKLPSAEGFSFPRMVS